MGFDYPARVERLQQAMSEGGVDVTLLSVGADLPYFIGYEAMPTERLTVLVVAQQGDPVLLVPQLEAPRVIPGDFEVRAWGETEDPVSLAARAAGSPGLAAVGDHMWSAFLVGFQKEWPHAEWLRASDLTRHLRMRKDPEEIEALRKAAHAVDRVMTRIPGEVQFAGRSERQVSHQIVDLVLEEGHQKADFAIVASGPNGASPHHEPGEMLIEQGDLVVCDFGGRWDGYHSDSTRTFSVGEAGDLQREVHQIVLSANQAGRAVVAPGVRCEEVDHAARQVIEEAGYGDFFLHRTGHGIGLEVHEHPYMVEGNELPIEPGMTFSIEPGIYLPGRFGVRIEDITACGPGGPDVFNLATRELIIVG